MIIDPRGEPLSVDLTDEQLTSLMVEELRGTRTVILALPPALAFTLVGVVQLALRHPGISEGTREAADLVLDSIREAFADCPTVLETIRRGDDPECDL